VSIRVGPIFSRSTAGNSPSIAGRYGAAFQRLLRTRCPLFQGTPGHNTWWGVYQNGTPYNPRLGQGRILIGADGESAVLSKGHYDDFLLHGPTFEKTTAALTAFLDCAVDVGFLCHPGKLTPPSHVVKYAGLIFDSTSEPILCVPEYKVDKAIAMIDYVLAQHKRTSRLSLAVVVGVLESMVEATPSQIGYTYLRHLHTILHPVDWDGNDLPYFSFTSLDECSTKDLTLWKRLLTRSKGRRARAIKSGTLIPSFDDGSGTATGSSVRYHDAVDFEMWMGVWSPCVYCFSSNWKEARTLYATLQRAHDQHQHDLRGVTFFYFTDNMTTYYTVTSGSSTSPGIHSLVEDIKLEIDMGIVLEMIHVPGITIITEGTDGLSRGIWSTPLHQRPDRHILLAEIFAPVPFTFDVGD
jgi:hypothetical protein